MLVSLLLPVQAAAFGGEFTVTPSLGLSGGYDDNINFSRTDKKEDFTGIISPSLGLDYQTPRFQLGLSGNMDLVRYRTQTEENNDRFRAGLSNQWMATEKLSLNLNGSYSRSTSLEEELERTGQVTGRTETNTYQISTGLAYRLTERSSMSANYNFSRNMYENPNQVNFNSQGLSAAFSYQLSEIDTLSLQPEFSWQDSETNQSRSYSLSLGLSHRFDGQWGLSVSLGPRYTEQITYTYIPRFILNPGGFPPVIGVRYRLENKSTILGGTGSLTATYAGWHSSANFGYSHQLTNDSEGNPIQTHRINAGYRYQFTERLSAVVSASFTYSTSAADRNSSRRNYFNVTPSLMYQIDENTDLSCSYQFSRSDDLDLPGNSEATRHKVSLSLNFRWPEKY